MYKSAFIYIIMVCTDGMTTCMCPCVLFAAIGTVCYWLTVSCMRCAPMQILYNYGFIFVSLSSVLLYHYILLINITRHGFCLTMFCLSDDLVVFDCLSLSLIYQCVYYWLLVLMTVLLLIQIDSFILGDNRL